MQNWIINFLIIFLYFAILATTERKLARKLLPDVVGLGIALFHFSLGDKGVVEPL
jgi:glycerol uptake facilitator-like aquaporin